MAPTNTHDPLGCVRIIFAISLILVQIHASPAPTTEPTNFIPTPEPTPHPTPNPTAYPTTPCCQCLTDKNTSGCTEDRTCEDEICDIHSFCCTSRWNTICTNLANISCTGTSCCECTSATPGIAGCAADLQCEKAICNLVDPYMDTVPCCNTEWDANCADLAQSFCALNSPDPTTAPPTFNPTTFNPTVDPTSQPTLYPTLDTINPSLYPTGFPTSAPTLYPISDTNNPSLYPTDFPVLSPTLHPSSRTINPSLNPTQPSRNPVQSTHTPTAKPSYHMPDQCDDKCDAFSVTIDGYTRIQNTMSITYKVSRLFDNGVCTKSIKYMVLGLCDGDQVSVNDLNGLIEGFVVDDDAGSDDSASDDSSDDSSPRYIWATNARNEMIGIRVNIHVDEALEFTLSLKNVFTETFSNTVRFGRGTKKFTCSEDGHLNGLPCVDWKEFVGGRYGASGLNVKYEKYGGNKEKNIANAMIVEKGDDEGDSSWNVLVTLDPYIVYSLLGILVVFGVFVVICGVYTCQNRNDEQEAVNDKNIKAVDIDHKHDSLPTRDDDDETELELTLTNIEETTFSEHEHSLIRFG
eukprot:85601_1